jgi:ATP synthase protein I
VHSGDETTVPRDPYAAMLRGGLVPAAAVGLVALAVATAVQGGLGAAGSALATVVVLVSSASTFLFLRRMAGLDPRVMFLGAMVGYFFKVGLLGVFLVAFRNADWLSPMAFAVTAVLVSLAGTTGEIVAFTRVKTYIYDQPTTPPATPPVARR